ncbi:MAG: hypothetical protein KGQ63_03350 [Betaproteobacteria bacterium]|nr:hypothetical protein [Betaproteobacteria bacterium]
MLKRRGKGLLAAIVAAFVISGCGGGGGGSGGAPVPTLLSATPGDSQVTLNWDSVPGIYYWIWWIQSTVPVTIGQNGNAVGGNVNVLPPYVMFGMINGLPYSFSLNAHAGDPNAPGGPQSNSLSVTPRLAGASWTPCTASGSTCPAGAPTIYGLSMGVNAGIMTPDFGIIRNYLAVGSGGQMFVSPDAKNWSALPAQSACTPSGGGSLRATDFGWSTFVAVGDNGTLCFSGLNLNNPSGLGLDFVTTPATANWYPATTVPAGMGTPNFYAVSTNQNGWAALGGAHVAVGSAGTIIFSGDGQNWLATAKLSTFTSDLYDVAYNFCMVPNWSWVAVGANGAMVGTIDPTGGTGWTTAGFNVGTTRNLRGVACSPNTVPPPLPGYPPAYFLPLYVAVGDGGVLLTSSDGLNWSTPSNFKIGNVAVTSFPVNMRRVTYGTQFVAVGDNGSIFTSLDGVNWTPQTSGTTANIYAITAPQATLTPIPNGYKGVVPFGYSVAGTNGFTGFGQ